jgi:hypothetical protein
MTPLPLPLALADELYRHGSANTPNTVADELVRMHKEIEATDRQVEILTDELTKCSKAYGGLQAENEALRADAERYRWLRNESWAGYHSGDASPKVFTVDGAGNRRMMLAEEAMDAAIDATLAQGEKT